MQGRERDRNRKWEGKEEGLQGWENWLNYTKCAELKKITIRIALNSSICSFCFLKFFIGSDHQYAEIQ